ncbi:hypothetical protein BC629DRAFT_1442423 [Irpex lacteus]|nr:hypothetical protein BC629DRAFT_1442423 [Irpex lacteus]
MSSKQLVWLITGTSSGFGRLLTLSALARGDKVIATARARSLSKLDDLKTKGAYTYELDVNWPQDQLNAFAKKIIEEHGRVDVVVNNAGYVEVAPQETSTPEQVAAQFNTNVFAPININRAFLPYLREQKTGTIVWIGSVAGWWSDALVSLYCATKHAVRALSVGLDSEISPFGLRSIVFEPGYFRTDFLATEHMGVGENSTSAYDERLKAAVKGLQDISGKQLGNPEKGAEVIVDVIRGEGVAAGKKIPPYVALGSDTYRIENDILDSSKKILEEWKDVAYSTDFQD